MRGVSLCYYLCIFYIIVTALLIVFYQENDTETLLEESLQVITNYSILSLETVKQSQAILTPVSNGSKSLKGKLGSLVTRKTSVTLNLTEVYKTVPFRSSSVVPRTLSREQHHELLLLLRQIQFCFKDYSISWFMGWGTLLGSFLCHDILPWDSDLDIHVDYKGMQQAKTLYKSGELTEKCGLNYHYSPDKDTHKLYFANAKQKAGNRPWSWPYVDVTTYPGESWNRHRAVIPRSVIYPLHMRPFGSLWLPAPHDPWYLLSVRYGTPHLVRHVTCFSPWWDHVQEQGETHIINVNCDQLKSDYPFAWRQRHENGTLETLKFNGESLYSVILDEPYHEKANPYNWQFLPLRNRQKYALNHLVYPYPGLWGPLWQHRPW